MKGRGLNQGTGNCLDKHLERSLSTQQLVENLTAVSERWPSVGGKLSWEKIIQPTEIEIPWQWGEFREPLKLARAASSREKGSLKLGPSKKHLADPLPRLPFPPLKTLRLAE